jgi:hypothetical protein
MNTLMLQFRQVISLCLIVCAFGCFAPQTQAVVPTPDGAYPNFTTAEGQNALKDLTTGAGNTALGAFSMFSTTTASFNTAVGAGALDLNTGDQNTAVGVAALLLNTGLQNTAVGVDALGLNTTGESNAAVGAFALYNNTTGAHNAVVGNSALQSNTTGGGNTAIGLGALLNNTTGSANTAVGSNAGVNVFTALGVTCIGEDAAGADVSNTTWISNVYGVTTQSGTTAPVVVSDTGQLGTVASSERFKKDIASMEKASETILSLRPVTFHYKTDTKGVPQFGLLAEEVAKVNPALVLPDKEGKPYTVRYDAVNTMLLNEFLKEHRKVEQQDRRLDQQETIIAKQQKQIEALTAGLQKVNAQLEVSKPAPQTVLNNQ